MTYVIDSSIAVKWVIPELLSEKADEIRARDATLMAPDLLLVEAANALWRKTVRKEISAREADEALGLLGESGVDLKPTGSLLPRALGLARSLAHPVYDCVYLALAERERATLVTADTRFIRRLARHRPRVRVLDLARL
jgi:predicted nucleic acid-binding protein